MKIEGLENQIGTVRPDTVKDRGFMNKLVESLKKVDETQALADKKFEQFLVGQADTVELISSLNKAELSFKMLVEVRNKLISALHELLRMQV